MLCSSFSNFPSSSALFQNKSICQSSEVGAFIHISISRSQPRTSLQLHSLCQVTYSFAFNTDWRGVSAPSAIMYTGQVPEKNGSQSTQHIKGLLMSDFRTMASSSTRRTRDKWVGLSSLILSNKHAGPPLHIFSKSQALAGLIILITNTFLVSNFTYTGGSISFNQTCDNKNSFK